MGYDADIVAFKKRTLELYLEKFPKFTFCDLYTDYLFDRINLNEDVTERGNEEATWIFSPHRDIFNEFFKDELESGEVRIIEKETYLQFFEWIEERLKKTTLYSLVDDEDKDEEYISTLINTYRNMRDKPVDFETEFVVFQHDW